MRVILKDQRGFVRPFGRVVCFVFSLSTLLMGFPVSVAGATCAEEIERIDLDLKSFERNITDQNLDFVKTDVADAALSGVKKRLSGDPTSDALFDLKQRKEQFEEFVRHLGSFESSLKELKKCLATEGCSLQEFAQRQNQAIARWIQSFKDEGINAATERVNKAASLIQGYAQRALSMTEGSALRTVENCIGQFDKRVQAQAEAQAEGKELIAEPPGPRSVSQSTKAADPPPAPTSAPSPSSGPSVLGAVAVGVGVAAGAALLISALQPQEESCSKDACTYSSFSGSCSCQGFSRNTTCDTSQLPMASEGEACTSGNTRIAWCPPNTACTNGRCSSQC